MSPYHWRKCSPQQRAELLSHRIETQRVWHAPTHFRRDRWFHITAACYNHCPHIGRTKERLRAFSCELLRVFREPWARWQGWCVLPNHYHVLAEIWACAAIRQEIGKLHGRNSHGWNVEENKQGRKVFHRFLMKEIRSPAHWWSTLNYIHHNPVRHGYVDTWREWPFSSAEDFLQSVPRNTAKAIWTRYPITRMGENWDEVEMESKK